MHTITIEFDEHMLAQIENLAKLQAKTRESFIKEVIALHLKNEEDPHAVTRSLDEFASSIGNNTVIPLKKKINY